MDSSPAGSSFQESATIKFEWTLRGLNNLFESSKSNTVKSRVVKSARFGGGRWQVLFYANSGNTNADGHAFVSLYLSCEPTAEEKEISVDGKWARQGLYKFGFELRNPPKTVLYNNKEAHDHAFSYQTQNWGWAHFARRDLVYYQSTAVKQTDTFVIICTITSSPSVPPPPSAILRHAVPKDLLNAMGSLLDDPIYSDVEFVLPCRGRNRQGARKIYAARRLLKRVDYFDAMFHSGFAEGASDRPSLDLTNGAPLDRDAEMSDYATDSGSMLCQFEDSDDEEDSDEMTLDNDIHEEIEHALDPMSSGETLTTEQGPPENLLASWTSIAEDENPHQSSPDLDEETRRNVRAKLSHPSTPRARDVALELETERERQMGAVPAPPMPTQEDNVPGPKKVRVVIRDVAYATYRAVLYYIYTDTIVFAPLSSSFLATDTPPRPASVASTPNASESQPGLAFGLRASHQQADGASGPRSRREWIANWERANVCGRPRPCSAKAVYRLADRLDLEELKERAFQHVVRSLTVENVAYEVFSAFSAAFEDVRKVQVRFFLENWADIRASDAMRSVWQQIRVGRHPGFEEVWPVIATNLEFKAPALESADGDGKDGTAGES